MEKCGGTGFLTVRNPAAPEINKIVRDLCEDTKIGKERPSRRYRSRISRRLPVSLVTGNAEAPAVSGPRSGVTTAGGPGCFSPQEERRPGCVTGRGPPEPLTHTAVANLFSETSPTRLRMVRPGGDGRSLFRHGTHSPAPALTGDGKQRYVFGDTGRAGLHNLSIGIR